MNEAMFRQALRLTKERAKAWAIIEDAERHAETAVTGIAQIGIVLEEEIQQLIKVLPGIRHTLAAGLERSPSEVWQRIGRRQLTADEFFAAIVKEWGDGSSQESS